MEMNHFSHEHPLVLSEEKWNKHFRCGGCCEPIFGVSYCCLVCPYVLHKYCADVPRELPPHKDHPDHPLVLHLPETLSICENCETEIFSFVYSCNDGCPFDLHFFCATYPYLFNYDYSGQNLELRFSFSDVESHKTCSICQNHVSGSYLIRHNNDNMVYHFQCMLLPQVVKHDRHRHEFTLRTPLKEKEKYEVFYCDLCEEERNPDDHVYYCEPCGLVGHIGCGVSGIDRPVQDVLSNFAVYKIEPEKPRIKKPVYQFGSYKDGETIEDGGDLKFVQTVYCSMKHPMVLTYFMRTIRERCTICASFIYGISYSCKECNFHIHKRCTEVPKEIHHSRFGLLKLFKEGTNCLICSRSHYEKFPFFLYRSEGSAAGIDGYCIYCALMPVNLNLPSHEHVLTPVVVVENSGEEDIISSFITDIPEVYKDIIGPLPIRYFGTKLPKRFDITPLCHACGMLCNDVVLECESCKFYLHVFCSLLPLTGKHTRHRHELSLTYSYKEDPIALEFICDTCEKPRIPNRGVYYCPDPKCVIVSHIECMDADIFNTYDIKSELPADFQSLGLG